MAQAAEARHVLVAMIIKPAAWQHFGLLPAQRQFVEALASRSSVILASLGSPYSINDFPRGGPRLCTFSDVAVSQQALAAILTEG